MALEAKAVTLLTEVFKPQHKKPEADGLGELLWVLCGGQPLNCYASVDVTNNSLIGA